MWGETTIEKKFRMAPSLEPPLLGSVKARRSWHPQARLHASDVVFRQTCTCLLFSIFERFFQEIRDHSFFDVIVQKILEHKVGPALQLLRNMIFLLFCSSSL